MSTQTPNFNRGLLKYVKGDATQPNGAGYRMIIHCCNNVNAWGAGFVLALSKRWSKPEQMYHHWFRCGVLDRVKFELGQIQIVDIQSDLAVVNMIGQDGIGGTVDDNGVFTPPVRYEAIRACLNKLAKEAKDRQGSIHAPRFGSGLSGGSWDVIEQLINECLVDKGINVTIYDFEEKN